MRPACLAAVVYVGFSAVAWAQPEVEIELVMRGRVPATAPHEWSARLAAAGFSRPQIRNARGGDELQIVTEGSQRRPVYRVTGYLSEDGSVVLPPRARFGARDTARLARWVQDLKQNGPTQAAGATGAFGLTEQRLAAVTKDLQPPVAESTRGADAAALLTRLGGELEYPLSIDAAARRALAGDGAVRDELKGLSRGTALAAILRPAGLVLRPRYAAGQLQYAVLESRVEGDNWPIGWASDKAPGRALPQLFDKEETQEVEVPLAAALNELASRTRVPFLLDHNGMARHRIDPARVMVTMRAGRMSYSSIIGGLLRQAGLQYELRVDEADKPFLWITTLRR